MSTHCTACGQPWQDHPGIARTCADLRATREAFVALAAEALNARTALRGLLRAKPESAAFRYAVKMAEHVLASPIVTLP